MIAAVLAPSAPSVIERHARALGVYAGNSAPTASLPSTSASVFSFAGSPSGRLDPAMSTAWIGSLRDFSPDAPLRSRGDFAFVTASPLRGDEISLGRGRFGGRPLYYGMTHSGKSVLACSRLAPLVSALDDHSLCADAIGEYLLGGGPSDTERTLYRQIRRVPSGCVVRVGIEGVRSRDQLERLQAPSRRESVDDLSLELRDQIARAVERAITPFDDVALSVSGGVDSSALLAMMLEVARKTGRPRVRALNVAFGGLGDDRPHLRSLSAALGVLPSQIRPRDCGSALFDSFVVDGAPLRWVNACWEIRLTQMSTQFGASVLLSGGGGDAVFDGDVGIIADRARQGRLFSALHTAATLKGWGSSTAHGRIRRLVLSPLVRMAMGSRLRRVVRNRRQGKSPTWAGPRLRSWIDNARPLEGEEFALSRDPDWLHGLATSSAFSDFADSRGQLETAGGCTRIEPFLDDDLVEFLASVPAETFFHGGWVRGLFRHSMRDVLPDDVRMRSDKADFEEAFLELVQAAGGFGAFEALLAMTALADYGLVEPSAFRARFEELAKTPLNGFLWLELWPVLAAEAFVRGPQSLP